MAGLSRPDLSQLLIGVSVSESADLYRLGFSEGHLRLALGEIARTILVHGGTLCYGGHLLPTGYTNYLVQELERYGDLNHPLLVCLAWSEHATLTRDALERKESEYGLYARVIYLDLEGNEIPRTERGTLSGPLSKEDRALSLTAMRRYISKVCSARILLGGKLHDFQGAMPGLIEESLLALREGTPLFWAGGFGGATLEVLRALDTTLTDWLPMRRENRWDPNRESQDALDEIHVLWTNHGRQEMQARLMDQKAMRQLAGTYRPSEIATLIGQALVRLADTKTT